MNRAHKNQRQRILDLLIAARGGWVSAVELGRISLQYCARVREARLLGFDIENRTEHLEGKTFGFYRIRTGMPRPVEPVIPKPQPKLAEATLFDLSPYPD